MAPGGGTTVDQFQGAEAESVLGVKTPKLFKGLLQLPGAKKLLSHFVTFLLVTAMAWNSPYVAAAQESAGGTSSYSGQGVPLTTQELQSLVAPIALYPDALVAQILNAATFPDQVAAANYWLSQNNNLTGNTLMKAVDGQSWDPSVKALTEFPSVLNNLAQNLSWTSQLGEAYHNQSAQVMSAIQTLRAQAKSAGNLKTTPQQTVTVQSQGAQQIIVIQPSNPQVVYVPEYNPTVIYGVPYTVPGYSTADLVATGLLAFGAGMAIGALAAGGCCHWGYSSWNCSWYGGGAYYHGAPYYGNPAWHGGYNNGYNNYHPFNGTYDSNGYHPYNNGYNSGYNSNGNRPGSYNGGYNSTYHPNNGSISGNNGYRSGNTGNRGNTSGYGGGNSGNMNRGNTGTSTGDRSGSYNSDASRGWGGSQDSGSHNTAFSGYGNHSGSGSGGSGWSDRSASSQGWGSRGGGGGWSGGRSGGGGFRR